MQPSHQKTPETCCAGCHREEKLWPFQPCQRRGHTIPGRAYSTSPGTWRFEHPWETAVLQMAPSIGACQSSSEEKDRGFCLPQPYRWRMGSTQTSRQDHKVFLHPQHPREKQVVPCIPVGLLVPLLPSPSPAHLFILLYSHQDSGQPYFLRNIGTSLNEGRSSNPWH